VENIKPFEPSELAAIKEKFSPFLAEVRKRVFLTFLVFAIATAFGFIFNEKIIKLLVSALSLEGINIVFTSPFQFINLAISCGITTGLIVVLPFFITQVLHFLKPALKRKEFKTLVRFLPLSTILFLAGFIFGSIIMKWQIEIFLTRSVSLGIGNTLDISRLLTTVFLTSVLMGIGFQFPIILLLLMRIGVVKASKLSKKRLWVYLGSFIFTLFLPPDSILADVILSLPFIILFELTLILNRILGRKKT
jgi:sec-independent protein translocase protein TatC